jgi:nanoRNase/pAp phosphatase (c-di-AMP/oligoRNAs hydrolase)
MGEGKPFAACYWDTPGGRVFSLRSANDGLDVSEIAAKFGGGGHKHASGFRLAFDDLHKLANAL